MTRKYTTDGEGVTKWLAKTLYECYPNKMSKQELEFSALKHFENPRNKNITKTNVSFAFRNLKRWNGAIQDEFGLYQFSGNILALVNILSKFPTIKS